MDIEAYLTLYRIKVTSLERTLVDILDRPDLAGGWEEVWCSLDHVIHFDIEKLIHYTLLLNNATKDRLPHSFLRYQLVQFTGMAKINLYKHTRYS